MTMQQRKSQDGRSNVFGRLLASSRKKVRAFKMPRRWRNFDYSFAGFVALVVVIIIAAVVFAANHLIAQREEDRAIFEKYHPVANFSASEAAPDLFIADKNAPRFEARIEELSLTVKTVAPNSTVVNSQFWNGSLLLGSLGSWNNVPYEAGDWRVDLDCMTNAYCSVGENDARLTVSSIPGASVTEDVIPSTGLASGWAPISLCDAAGVVSYPHFTEAVVDIDGYAYRIVGNPSMTQMQNDDAWNYLHESLCFETNQGDHAS